MHVKHKELEAQGTKGTRVRQVRGTWVTYGTKAHTLDFFYKQLIHNQLYPNL